MGQICLLKGPANLPDQCEANSMSTSARTLIAAGILVLALAITVIACVGAGPVELAKADPTQAPPHALHRL